MIKITNSSNQPRRVARNTSEITFLFELNQHARDEQLMKNLIKYFDCGSGAYYATTRYARGASAGGGGSSASLRSKFTIIIN